MSWPNPDIYEPESKELLRRFISWARLLVGIGLLYTVFLIHSNDQGRWYTAVLLIFGLVYTLGSPRNEYYVTYRQAIIFSGLPDPAYATKNYAIMGCLGYLFCISAGIYYLVHW